MSGRLCCHEQQQHSKLLAQSVFKVSVFHFNTRMKMLAPLRDCCISNVLIQFVLMTSRWHRHYAVKVVS